jgi:hypothetical protein
MTPALDDERVHEARKALKSARALLRLLRPCLGEAAYLQENIALRDAARDLSELRDARTVLASLGLIGREARRRKVLKTALDRQREVLQVRLERVREVFIAEAVAVYRFADRVGDSRERVRAALKNPEDSKQLVEAFSRISRKVRRSFGEAVRSRTDESLHEWRKQTKYLLTAAGVLRDAGVKGLRGIIKQAARIAGWLGDDHDLAILSTTISKTAGDTDAMMLLPLIQRRRMRLQTQALRAGSKLCGRKQRRGLAGVRRLCPRRSSRVVVRRRRSRARHGKRQIR